MRVRALLPDARRLRLEQIDVDEESGCVVVRVRSNSPSCKCPECSVATSRVHSWYERKLNDLPWQGLRVEILWLTRRLFCDNADCSRKIFAERQPDVALSYSRRTERLSLALRCIAFACGGKPGARLAERLGMIISSNSLLRQIRRTNILAKPTPRALGVDDWAFRKGKRYGTLLCDLERGHPVELLPERGAQALTDWLRANPGVEIITRDRGENYIQGATEGAPQARQVADRFHLLQNIRNALARFLESKKQEIRQAVSKVSTQAVEEECVGVSIRKDSQVSGRSTSSRSRRLALYDRVIDLNEQGVSARSIASQLGIHRSTVAKFVRAATFPERGQRDYPTRADEFKDYLWDRWKSGCHNARRLTDEIKQRGFTGHYSSVRRLVARWRRQDGTSAQPPRKRFDSPTGSQLSWLLVRKQGDLTEDERVVKQALLDHCQEIQRTWNLAADFVQMLRERRSESLDSWLDRATGGDTAPSLRRFAEGLKKDLAAVTAALSLRWNNGPAEGHISRLKMLKRQMYGRAHFDLLRARFLYAA